MNKQTEDYLSLKPIADRFRETANKITDEELESIIKDEIRKQIDKQLDFSSFGNVVKEIIENWFEDDENTMFIMNTLKESITRRLR